MMLSDEYIDNLIDKCPVFYLCALTTDAKDFARAIERAVLEKAVPIKSGKNRYGVDMDYMSRKISLLLRDLENYKPDEAARVLLRLARVADKDVFSEKEFTGEDHIVSANKMVSPDFLIEISNQMRTQDNRGTSHPFFQVRCKRYVVTEQGYNEVGFEIIGDDSVVYRSYASEEDDLENLLLSDYPEFCKEWCESLDNGDSIEDAIGCFDPTEDDLPDGLRLVYVQEIEEVVSTHLTESAAKQFIRRKQHDYPKLYTYAESAYWSPQLRELQDWIVSLTAENHIPDAGKMVPTLVSAPSVNHSPDSGNMIGNIINIDR